MLTNVVIPSLGVTSSEVTFEQWLVSPGDFIKKGSSFFIVTTDKATVEVEAYKDGYVKDLLVKHGEQVSIGAIIATLVDTEYELSQQLLHVPTEQQLNRISNEQQAPQLEISRTGADKISESDQILASPIARRMAKEAGINLFKITPTGPRGEITKQDVLHELEKINFASQGPDNEQTYHQEALSAMRRSIAERSSISKSQIPHFYASLSIDMTEARMALEEAAIQAEKIKRATPTVTDLCIFATAKALRRNPQLNATFQGDSIRYFEEVNIGMVVGSPEGIIIPIIRQADQKDLITIASLTIQLKEKANLKRLQRNEITGGTFTISNLGMHGLDNFIAVINPPEVGILALGTMKLMPAIYQEQIVPRWQMIANLSVDHRVVDGLSAAKFLNSFKELLEHPSSLIS